MNDGIFKEREWAKLERPERLQQLNIEESLKSLNLEKGQRVADYGTGTGVFIPYILEAVGSKGKVYAVDYSEKMLNIIKERLGRHIELELVQKDLNHFDWEHSKVDRGVLCHVAHELENLQEFLMRIRRTFEAGGVLEVIEWAYKEQPKGPPLHKRIEPEKLKATLEAAGWAAETPKLLGEDFYLIIARS